MNRARTRFFITALISFVLLTGCSREPVASPEPTTTTEIPSIADQFETVKGGVVRLEVATCVEDWIGSGFLIDENHIVTVAHVVEDAQNILVYVGDETAYAEIVGIDLNRDIALLETDVPVGSHYFELGEFEYRPGETVSLLGFPLGLDLSLTTGVISNADVTFDDLPLVHFIQIDAPANPGNSGGPVINSDGEAIGIVDWQLSNTQGLNFAISTNTVDRIFESWASNDTQELANCISDAALPTPTAPPRTTRPPATTTSTTTTIPMVVEPGTLLISCSYFNEEDGKNHAEICTAPSDGSSYRQITANTHGDYPHAWSTDGGRILFTHEFHESGNFHMQSNGADIKHIDTFQWVNLFPATANWSPDNTQIAYTDYTPDGHTEIFIANVDGTNRTQLTAQNGVVGSHDWSADGKKIVFHMWNGNLSYIDVDTKEVHEILSGAHVFGTLRWSPDDEWIAFPLRENENTDMYIVREDGTELTRLTYSQMGDLSPVWSPDGTQIAFLRGDNYDNRQVVIMEIASKRTIHTGIPAVALADWKP
jgi:hypothetical protein